MGNYLPTTNPETKYYPEFLENLPSLEGKTVAITGCTSGTGLIVATSCAKKGAKNILMLNRSSARAEAAQTTVKDVADASKTTIDSIACDLQDFASVREAAATIKKNYSEVDVLCNNAGVMALPDKATKDGYDVELFPLLKKAADKRGEARIVHHSSEARMGPPLEEKYFDKRGGDLGGDEEPWFSFFGGPRWQRYHQSKLANSVMTAALAAKLKDTKIKATVAAPGLANTNLQTTSNEHGGMGGKMWIMYMSQSAEDGTMPILSACFDPEAANGDLYQPKKTLYGPSIKTAYDKETANPANAELLWRKSEEALGKFEP